MPPPMRARACSPAGAGTSCRWQRGAHRRLVPRHQRRRGSVTPTASSTSEQHPRVHRDEARSLPRDPGRTRCRPTDDAATRHELRSLAERYAQGVDRRDVDTFVALFHDDAVITIHDPSESDRAPRAPRHRTAGEDPRGHQALRRRRSTCSASRPTRSATARRRARCTASPTTSPPTTPRRHRLRDVHPLRGHVPDRRRRRVEVRRSAACGSTGPRRARPTRRPGRRHAMDGALAGQRAVVVGRRFGHRSRLAPARWRATARR